MTILYMTILSVFYLVNARVYMLTYSLLAEKKYEKKAIYNVLWLMYAGIIVLKQVAKLVFDNEVLLTMVTIILVGYQISLVLLFYSGTVKQKLIDISVPNLISFFADALTIFISTTAFQMNVEELSKLSVENIIATAIESFLLILTYILLVFIISRKRRVFFI